MFYLFLISILILVLIVFPLIDLYYVGLNGWYNTYQSLPTSIHYASLGILILVTIFMFVMAYGMPEHMNEHLKRRLWVRILVSLLVPLVFVWFPCVTFFLLGSVNWYGISENTRVTLEYYHLLHNMLRWSIGIPVGTTAICILAFLINGPDDSYYGLMYGE